MKINFEILYIFIMLLIFMNLDGLLARDNEKIAQETLSETLNDLGVGVYVILSNVASRRQQIKALINSMNLKQHTMYFEQVDKSLYLQSNYTQRLIRKHKIDAGMASLRKNAGIFACSFSHKKLLENFLKSDKDAAIMLEDDVILAGNMTLNDGMIKLAKALQIPRREWNIQYLGWCYELCTTCDATCSRCLGLEGHVPFGKSSDDGNGINYTGTGALYAPAMRPLCTHSFILDRVSAALLLNNFFPVHDAYDNYITDTACKYDLKAIRTLTPLFDQDRSDRHHSKRNTIHNGGKLYPFRHHDQHKLTAYLYYCRNKFDKEKAWTQDEMALDTRGFENWEYWYRNIHPEREVERFRAFNATLAGMYGDNRRW